MVPPSVIGPVKTACRLGSATFHAERHEVAGRLGRVQMTPMQGKILRLLLENEGRMVSTEQIMAKVWPLETERQVNVVKTHVSHSKS